MGVSLMGENSDGFRLRQGLLQGCRVRCGACICICVVPLYVVHFLLPQLRGSHACCWRPYCCQECGGEPCVSYGE